MKKQKPSFEQAMNVTMLWCKACEEGSLSDEVLADRIAELIESKEGSRGFFVISLSSDCPLMDRLPEPVVVQLRKSGESIVELTTKNLAMSSAMAEFHQKNNDRESFSSSKRITERCIDLLRLLEPTIVKNHLEELLDGLNEEEKNTNNFLKRCNYDNDQKIAIIKSINAVAEN